ncbi:MAG TPA: hypothetical protein DD420_13135 [Streptomyces sp.]|nr:hypothetical protein [Streptomyces sp.]
MTYAEERILDEIKQRILEEPYSESFELGALKFSLGNEVEIVLPTRLYYAMKAGLNEGYKLKISDMCFKLITEIWRAGYDVRERKTKHEV